MSCFKGNHTKIVYLIYFHFKVSDFFKAKRILSSLNMKPRMMCSFCYEGQWAISDSIKLPNIFYFVTISKKNLFVPILKTNQWRSINSPLLLADVLLCITQGNLRVLVRLPVARVFWLDQRTLGGRQRVTRLCIHHTASRYLVLMFLKWEIS